MTAVVLIIVHLLSAAWLAWSVGMMLRLRRQNAELADENARMRTAVIEATGALNARSARTMGVMRTVQRDRARRALPAQIFGDAEGRN